MKFDIQNRRYMGSKYKLLDFIKEIVENECTEEIRSVMDVFSGTGVVSSIFLDKEIITNDTLYSNYISHVAWYSPDEYNEEKVNDYIDFYNTQIVEEDNYMSINFSNTFFDESTCKKIGFIREHIETLFINNKINFKERALLITSLLYAMDKIALSCGHYDAYRKNASHQSELVLKYPDVKTGLSKQNKCFNMDANELVKNISADLVYLDPPYNSRQYCDSYHLLENVARWEKPEVFGTARKMNRHNLKSDYCTTKATSALENLINDLNCKYILLSYNNTAEKANSRSNAKIKDDDIISILSKKGEVKIFSTKHKAFSTGKSKNNDNEERIFLCICKEKDELNEKNNNHKVNKREYIQSPLNYTGGKHKLLPQILPHFPTDIRNFIDLFCGGCNVGLNVEAKNIIFNDYNTELVGLFNTIKFLPSGYLFDTIKTIIYEYNLSETSKYGYSHYGCDSSTGLSNYNKEGYLKLRDHFNNATIEKDVMHYLMLYVLIVYGFNNQIRFNKKGFFNLPVGKRDFNEKMRSKLNTFTKEIKKDKYTFTNLDFRNFDINNLNKEDLVYVDPPYLISCATYNEQGKWNEDDEKELLFFLDKLDSRGVKFALSNILEDKGKSNGILKDWLNKNTHKYKTIHLDFNYNNSNYRISNKSSKTSEVLIINY